MKSFISLLALGILAVGTAALASDAWKDKPYQSWDQKDIQEILNNSPWGRQDVVSAPAGGGSLDAPNPTAPTNSRTSGGVVLAKPGEDVPDTSTGGAHGSAAAPGSAGGDAGNAPRGGGQIYVARWVSSRTVREAMARVGELNGHPAPDAAQKIAELPQTYQLLIISTNLSDFQQAGEGVLKDSIYLETKKNHEKIVPSKVTLATTGPNDPQVRGVIIDFPRTNASGAAAISPDEKEVDLIAVAGKTKLKFHFEITKMTDKQGADL